MASINTLNSITLNQLILEEINKVKNEDIPLSPLDIILKPIIDSDNFMVVSVKDDSNGILMEKIDISNFFPEGMDLSSFKDINTIQTPTLDYELGVEIQSLLTDEWIGADFNLLDKPGQHDKELLKRFILACKVIGLSILYPEDVYLNMDDDILVISVYQTHPFYKGTVRIKTW